MLMRNLHARGQRKAEARLAMAAVELACTLPVLVFCLMITVDFARVVYAQVALQNCARNGAVYELYTQVGSPLPSGWTSLESAVSADAPSGMTVTGSATPLNTNPNYVTVTVTTTFHPITLPSMPRSITLTQSATMPFPIGASAVP